MRTDKLPPHDIAAEEAVIAALLLDDDAYYRVATIVQPGDFFRDQNGWIYEACIAVFNRGESMTLPSVAHELDRRGLLDKAGGETYIADISGKYFTAIGVEAHAKIVARDALYRWLLRLAGTFAQAAYEGGPEPERVIDQTIAELSRVRDEWMERMGDSRGTGIRGEALFNE